MSSKRRYQLENLELDLSQRIRFTAAQVGSVEEEDDLDFYSARVVKLDRVLSRVQAKLGDFSLDKLVENL